MKDSYRPDIDGLRAIAVLAVIAFHFRPNRLPGGFVGVDIFFVISGYLITKMLVDDIDTGRLSILNFYDRRIRRIVPALVVVLLASIAAGFFVLLPGDYRSLSESAIYSAFGTGNLFFLSNTGYFDREATLQPLLHLWSLGVEEQFYLVWPLLLALLVWLGNGSRVAAGALVACVAALSFWSCVYLQSTDPTAAFYLPYPRAWELAAGAMAVFAPHVRGRFISEAISFAGIALIGWSLFALTDADPFPGWIALPCIVGAALLIWPREEGSVTRLLALPPMRFIGLISYSLYLWHWPVLVFYRHISNGELPPLRHAVPMLVFLVAVSTLSWHFVELPARRARLRPTAAVVAGLATSALVASIAAAVVNNNGFATRLLSAQAQAMSSLEVMWEWTCPQTVDVPGLGKGLCAFGAHWEEAPLKGILWGDSHAEHIAPIMEAAVAASGEDVSFLLYHGCPAALGGAVRRERTDFPTYVSDCKTERSDVIAFLRDHPEVSIVVLAASWSTLPGLLSQDGSLPGLSGEDLVMAGIEEVVRAVATDRTFILIGQVPAPGKDPVPCLLKHLSGIADPGCAELDASVWAYFAKHQMAIDERFGRFAAAHHNIIVVLPGSHLCRSGRCMTELDGEPLYRDGSHIRRNLAARTRRDYAEIIGLTSALKAIGH